MKKEDVKFPHDYPSGSMARCLYSYPYKYDDDYTALIDRVLRRLGHG